MQCIASQMSRYIYVRVACAYQRTGRRLSIDPVRYSFRETLVWVYFTSTRARRQARLSFRLVKFSVTTNHNAVTVAIELRWNKLALGPLHTVRYSLSCTIGFHAAFSCRVVVISINLLGCTTVQLHLQLRLRSFSREFRAFIGLLNQCLSVGCSVMFILQYVHVHIFRERFLFSFFYQCKESAFLID